MFTCCPVGAASGHLLRRRMGVSFHSHVQGALHHAPLRDAAVARLPLADSLFHF